MEKVMVNSSVTMVKYMIGTKRIKREYLEIWKIYLTIKLLTPAKLLHKKFSPPPTTQSEIALTPPSFSLFLRYYLGFLR